MSLTRRQLTQLGALMPFSAPFVRRGPLRERPRLAVIGAWNRGRSNLEGVLDGGAEVTHLVDVDARHLGHALDLMQGRGLRKPSTAADWRAVLEKPEQLDGVVISTPDHQHAPIASAALSARLAVYCEKPLSRTSAEARELLALAQKARVATQMGIQIHATENYRRVVEAIRGGAIGAVQTVHVLCSKSWSDGRYGAEAPVPAYLDWDLWLGSAEKRAYCEGLHPAWWRKFWSFGSGTVGDMACHWVDLVHWALELDVPARTEAEGPEVHADGTPRWLHATWHHPARGARPAVDVHWWDGGRKPDCAREGWDDCHIWIGTRGKLFSTYGAHEVVLDAEDERYVAPERSLAPSRGHYVEWLEAIAGGPAPSCDFEYSAPLTETVLRAAEVYRANGVEGPR